MRALFAPSQLVRLLAGWLAGAVCPSARFVGILELPLVFRVEPYRWRATTVAAATSRRTGWQASRGKLAVLTPASQQTNLLLHAAHNERRTVRTRRLARANSSAGPSWQPIGRLAEIWRKLGSRVSSSPGCGHGQAASSTRAELAS